MVACLAVAGVTMAAYTTRTSTPLRHTGSHATVKDETPAYGATEASEEISSIEEIEEAEEVEEAVTQDEAESESANESEQTRKSFWPSYADPKGNNRR